MNNAFSARLHLKHPLEKDMLSWLVDNVGWHGFEWQLIHYSRSTAGIMCFMNETDAMAFKIMFPEFCVK